jgi:hypothetical protein
MAATAEQQTPADFSQFLAERVGRNWVLARRSSRIVAKYGESVKCLSQKQYTTLEAEYERLTLRSAHGDGPSRALCNAAPDLLKVAQLFAKTIEYLIKVDMSKGDDEGARLKTVTLNMIVLPAIAKATS